MAKRSESVDVAKFGGTDNLGTVQMGGQTHEVANIEAQSTRKLEDDVGHGSAAIIRRFVYGMNPVAFKEHPPTKQELFNAHYKSIELTLWRDGMKVMPEIEPRLVLDTKKNQYYIFVGARPAKGHILRERPQTLAEIAHG